MEPRSAASTSSSVKIQRKRRDEEAAVSVERGDFGVKSFDQDHAG